MDRKKVLIAMSGGVDSTAAAWVLQQQGFDCVGAIMHLTGEGEGIQDARDVARRLQLPFHVLPMQAEFQDLVVEPFVRCYESGGTPNPCIACNRYMKFGLLLQAARQLGCDTVATGHYVRIRRLENGRYVLLKALDTAKDQSYFLYSLTQDQLAHTLFPLSEMTKEQVREIVQAQGFLNARRRDSQDICFIPDGDYMAFLRQYRGHGYPEGDFLDLSGKKVGRHSGAPGYTLGQRRGLGLAMGAPVYVCGKDMQANTVSVGPEQALFHSALRAEDWNFLPFSQLTHPIRVLAKARYRHIPQAATAYPEPEGRVRVEFDVPQRALTPGQAVVLYDGDLVIGGGTITEIL